MSDLTNLYFHESTIKNIIYKEDCLQISLDDVVKENGSSIEKISVYLFIKHDLKITTEDQDLLQLFEKYEDGEVLEIEMNEKSVFLLVEWNNFYNHTSYTSCHTIEGKQVFWERISKTELE